VSHPVPDPTRIVLVGLSGAGKSTAGREAVQRLRGAVGDAWEFVDLDDAIERHAGRTIREIFATDGEEGFRRLEAEATAALASRGRLILATGGGWVESGAVADRFRAASTVVFLQVSPAVAAARLGSSGAGRPLLAGGETEKRLRELLERRESTYLQANHVVNVDSLTVAEVASYIVALATAETGD
jgi:shikimate kinase